MAEAVSISVEPRDPAKNKGTGSRVSRKLRAAGRIPAILYGHKQANIPLSISHEDVWTLVKKGNHLAQLRIGNTTEMALIRNVQWDHLGRDIIHLDFYRVSAHERIKTEVSVVLHGIPEGVAEGGVLDQPVHSITVSCEATAIPASIKVEVGHLQLNQVLHAKDITLPTGVALEVDPDTVLAHIVSKQAVAEPTGTEGAVTQPEIIGRKEKKEEV